MHWRATKKALELNSGSYDITMKLADMYYQVGDYKGFSCVLRQGH